MSVQQIDPAIVQRAGRPDATDERGRWVALAPWIAAVAAAAAAIGPLVFAYFRQLWSAEHYQFFPMLLAATAWVAWKRFHMPVERPARRIRPFVRASFWTVAFLLTAAAVFAQSPLGAFIALLVLSLAGLYERGGSVAVRHFLPVWALLLLIVRPPFGWDQKMVVALQKAASRWASGTLDLMEIRHLVDGVAISLPEREFFVDQACSGVHSLFATLAFVGVFAVVMRRGLIRSALLLLAGTFWVLVANVVRVVAVVVLSARYDLPVVDGVGHEVLGIVVFAGVIGLVLSTDRLFLFLYPQQEVFPTQDFREVHAADFAAGRSGGASVHRGMAGAYVVAMAFVAAAAVGWLMPSAAAQTGGTPYASAAGLTPVPENALPATWDGWQRYDFQVREREKGDPAGEISRIWYFRKGRLSAAVSIDGPFDAWHDTEVCYDALGYTTDARADHRAPGGRPSPGGFTELSITEGGGRHGYVLFMAYSESGMPLRPPASRHASVARLMAAWQDRITGKAPDAVEGRVYQVQLFAKSGLAFSESERADLTGLFHAMREEIARVTTRQHSSEAAGVSDTGGGAT